MTDAQSQPDGDHVHDFRARYVTGFARLKKGRRRHDMTQNRACSCGLSERMHFHLLAESMGINPKDIAP